MFCHVTLISFSDVHFFKFHFLFFYRLEGYSSISYKLINKNDCTYNCINMNIYRKDINRC